MVIKKAFVFFIIFFHAHVFAEKTNESTTIFQVELLQTRGDFQTLNTTHDKKRLSQKILVADGKTAHFKSGFEIPYLNSVQNGILNRSTAIGYHAVNSGFSIQAFSQNDERVELKITASQKELSDDVSGKIKTENFSTVIHVPLNTWVQIAGNQSSQHSAEDNYETDRAEAADTAVWLRVEVFDSKATNSASSFER